MNTKVIKPTASISFVRGMYIQDLQLVIDDYEFFCSLPGKFERHGIKTIATWPVFVTLIYQKDRTENSPELPRAIH